MKLLNNGELIEEKDQRLHLDTAEDKDALDEGIIVWGRVDPNLVGQTYSVLDNGIIRRLES